MSGGDYERSSPEAGNATADQQDEIYHARLWKRFEEILAKLAICVILKDRLNPKQNGAVFARHTAILTAKFQSYTVADFEPMAILKFSAEILKLKRLPHH